MRQILPFVNINGQIVTLKSAKISIFNEGFLYGKGIFTTIKVRIGCPLFLERHLNRLQTSAQKLSIQLPSYGLNLTSYIQKAAYATIKKNKLVGGGIRITITPAIICIHAFTAKCHSREGGRHHEMDSTPVVNPHNNQIQKISVITTPDTRDIYKTHKITYRMPHLLAREKALSKDAEDALFTQNNELIESTTANIIAHINKDTIITPLISNNGLNGITRQILMENLPIAEVPIPISTTNPLILINSLTLRSVESIDGKKINQNPEFVASIQQAIDKAEKNYIASNSF